MFIHRKIAERVHRIGGRNFTDGERHKADGRSGCENSPGKGTGDFAELNRVLAANPSKIINKDIVYTNPKRGREYRFRNNVRSRAETTVLTDKETGHNRKRV